MKGVYRMEDWNWAARKVEEVYGAYADRDERWFLCPECGEPIYECDFENFEVCPVCGFNIKTGEVED